jgi:SAM-dependent methyltransferase
VTGIDLAEDAIVHARGAFSASNLEFAVGSCSAPPDGPFDLIVAFEVIEHLPEWRVFLQEARRVLSPGGQFLVSTPNKLYYAESRGQSGENPFHVHEFEYAEFLAELQAVFPHVRMLLQNHVEGVAFMPLDPGAVEISAGTGGAPEAAHFFLAICSAEPLPALDAFVWIPGTGNILREREHHIELLTGEVALKTQWLERSKKELDDRNREYEDLLRIVRELNASIEERNRWAGAAQADAEERGQRIVELQGELGDQQKRFAASAAGYEAKIAELDEVNRAKTEWALETERRLTQEIHERSQELARCVELLDRAEATVTERTLWAQGLQRDLEAAQTRLAALISANWVKVGSKLKLVPEQQ